MLVLDFGMENFVITNSPDFFYIGILSIFGPIIIKLLILVLYKQEP